MGAMEDRLLAVEQEPDTGAAPLRTLCAERRQEGLYLSPSDVRWDGPGEDRLQRTLMPRVHLLILIPPDGGRCPAVAASVSNNDLKVVADFLLQVERERSRG